MAASRTREVRLVDVPVATYRAAQQHADALLRELVLMAGYEAAQRRDGPMRRLYQRAGATSGDRLDLAAQAARDIDAAHARGDAYVTLVLTLPERVAASVEAWHGLLGELDALCRDGTMLSVPAGRDVARFAQWWCGELVRQLRDGAPPTAWRDHDEVAEHVVG